MAGRVDVLTSPPVTDKPEREARSREREVQRLSRRLGRAVKAVLYRDVVRRLMMRAWTCLRRACDAEYRRESGGESPVLESPRQVFRSSARSCSRVNLAETRTGRQFMYSSAKYRLTDCPHCRHHCHNHRHPECSRSCSATTHLSLPQVQLCTQNMPK